MYTKFIVVTDDDVNIRDWKEVVWAITTRVDPVRDTTLVENTPIDYLDFASPVSGLGGKMGLDATHKWPGETSREWGRTIQMPVEVTQKVSAMFDAVMSRATRMKFRRATSNAMTAAPAIAAIVLRLRAI